MRPLHTLPTARPLAALTVALLLSGCGVLGDGGGDAPERTEGAQSPAPVPSKPAPSDPGLLPPGLGSDQPDASDTEVCGLVRAGIDAFNRGEPDVTVERFTEALPLSEERVEQVDAEERASAEDLRDAVEYYATLPAEDYLEAAASSPEFERNKQITLGQCVAGVVPDPAAPEDDEGGGVLT